MAMNLAHDQLELFLADEQASIRFARRLAAHISRPLLCYFKGEIGAGKTTLIRALLRELGVSGAIKSPSYSIVESYALASTQIAHFDLYRVQDEEELEYIGWRDYFDPDDSLVCVEWPERAPNFLPNPDLLLELVDEAGGRRLLCRAYGVRGLSILNQLVDEGSQ